MPPACWRALEALRARLPVTAQAIRNGLAMVELPGRFQIVPGQPSLVLDVAPQSARGGGAQREPGCDGILPDHAMAVFGADGGQGPSRPMFAKIGPAGGPLVLHGPAHAALPRRRSAAGKSGRRSRAGATVPASTHPNPEEALRGRRGRCRAR
jgi:dihydrofolate synthase/folylpolyglutamate synthase